MKILVTGSEGVVAQQVIPFLLKTGHTIVGVDNLSKHNVIKNTGNYTFIKGDLTDSAFTNSLFKESYDYVFHFAAMIYGVLWYNKHPADVLSKNIAMTANILNNYHKIDKMIYISSSMVYERSVTLPNREEDTDTIPVMGSSYGLSKYVCERLIIDYNIQYGLDYLIWRPFNIFDIEEKVYKEVGMGHVFSDLFKKIVIDNQHPLQLLGDGEQQRSFIDIRDAAYAIANFSLDRKANNTVYNLGTDKAITIKQLSMLIADAAKSLGMLSLDYDLEFKTTKVHKHDVKKRVPDTNKLFIDFGWEPTINTADSINNYLSNSGFKGV
jgi:UDP-glucose 4-epimerase|tara:strand:- start:397 stop:1368 length:972 start_codon:yes stop_codon:yes gene_type:complete